jgi:hypothetical protein
MMNKATPYIPRPQLGVDVEWSRNCTTLKEYCISYIYCFIAGWFFFFFGGGTRVLPKTSHLLCRHSPTSAMSRALMALSMFVVVLGVWTQGLQLAKQALEPLLQSVLLWLFWWWGLKLAAWAGLEPWFSQVARITGVSPWHLSLVAHS